MKNSFRHVLNSLFVFIFITTYSIAYGTDYIFSSLGLEEGLSHPNVKCVLRDSKDYLWIGTKGGLNRFDKGKMKVYRRNPSFKNTLPDNDIENIFEDKEGRIWVICSTGVATYDRQSDSFIPVFIDNQPLRARSYLLQPVGIIFGGAGNLFYYDYKSRSLSIKNTKKGSSRYYTAIHPWTRDKYILATRWDGLWVYNTKNDEINPFDGFSGKRITASLIEPDGDLWVSVYGEGLFHIDRNGQSYQKIINNFDQNGIILNLLEIGGSLWIATDGNGIIKYDKISDKTERIDISEDAPRGLRSVNSLYQDSYNYVYAGTVRGGLTCIYPSPMKTFRKTSELETFTVTSLVKDSNKVWMGIDGDGIVLFEPENNKKMTHISSTQDMKIVSMANFDEKRLIVSSFDNGLFLFDKQRLEISPAPQWANAIAEINKSSGIPIDIVKLSNNKLAFISDKIQISDIDGKNLSTLSVDEAPTRLRAFYTDISNLLVFNEKEIYNIDLFDETITSLCRVKNPVIECCSYDGAQYIYAGTSSGIQRFDFETGLINPYGEDIASGAGITAITVLEGNLWIGANGRLYQRNISTGTTRSFGNREGVTPNDFIYKSTLVLPNNLLMGGVNGLLKINLDELADFENTRIKTPVELTEVIVDGLPVVMENNQAILPEKYSTVNIRLNGGSSHPMETEPVRIYIGGNKFEYPIETTDNMLTLGDFQSSHGGRLDIYASTRDYDGNWEKPIQIGSIIVPSVWWRKPIVIIIIAILAIAVIIFTVIYFISHRKQIANKKVEENKRKSLEKEVGYLMNLNYELRTPLTIIYSKIKLLRDNAESKDIPKEEMIVELDNIYRNTGKMRDIINTTVNLWQEEELKSEETERKDHITDWIKENLNEKPISYEDDPADFDMSHLTAIVVEDNQELRELLVSSLSKIFNRVLEAANGKDALTYIKNSNPDLIITEARLPEISGLELCRIIKKTKQFSHIPVIMLTTRLEEMNIANGDIYGADNYLTKPFNIAILEKRCVSVLKSFDRIKQWYKGQVSDILPHDKHHTNDSETFVLKVRDIIEQNLGVAGFGVDDIVNQMLVSRSTLYGKFKELTGQSLGNYILDRKLNRAKEMLLSTNMTINEISDALGFTTQRYFSTFFKDKTGMTPTAFRLADEEKKSES